jgi:hypothetical protein
MLRLIRILDKGFEYILGETGARLALLTFMRSSILYFGLNIIIIRITLILWQIPYSMKHRITLICNLELLSLIISQRP